MKYDWSNVPSHIMWIATDKNGNSYGYEDEPIIDHPSEWTDGYSYYHLLIGVDIFQGNWQDSLEERPK